MSHLESAKQAIKERDLITATIETTRAIEEDPQCCEAYVLRSQISMMFGDKDGAASDMQRAIEINPELLNQVSGEYKTENNGCH